MFLNVCIYIVLHESIIVVVNLFALFISRVTREVNMHASYIYICIYIMLLLIYYTNSLRKCRYKAQHKRLRV